MTELTKRMITSMQATASELQVYAAQAKEVADELECSRDARTVYNTLGPIDTAVDALKNAMRRLEE